MSLITSILLLLALALVLGELLQRFGMAAVIGEILAGVILGPIVLNLIQPSTVLGAISEISLFFIILYIGVESSTDTFRSGFGRSLILTITSFLIPLGFLATFSFYILGLNFYQASLLSIAIGVPSISIVSVLIKDNSLVKTKSGNLILSSVVITDLLALGATSILIAPKEVYVEVPGIIVFLLLLAGIDRLIRKNSERVLAFFNRIHAMERGEKLVLGAIIVGALFVSLIFELIGVSFVLGAFFAGLLINDVVLGEDLHGKVTRTLSRLDDSFFIPVFFSIAGIEATLPTSNYILDIISLVAIAAVSGGLLTYFVSRRIVHGVTPRMSTGILGSRGAVGIIIATLAFEPVVIVLPNQSIDSNLYSVSLFGTLLLSIIFSSLVRREDVIDQEEG